MKKILKTLLATAAISLFSVFTTGLCVSAAVSKGVENTVAWTFDSSTATLTLDKEKSEVITTESWIKFADEIQYIELKGTHIGEYMGYDSLSWYPNLKKLYGRWHNPQKAWTAGDPELLWELDLTGAEPVFTVDVTGNVFAGETPESFTCWRDIFDNTQWFSGREDGRLIIKDRVFQYGGEKFDLCPGEFGANVLELGKMAPVSEAYALIAAEEYIVDPANPSLAVYNGALYTKDYRTLLAIPYKHMDTPLHPNVREFGNKTLRLVSGTSSMEYDPKTKTATFKGSGAWSVARYSAYSRLDVDHIIISDGITEIQGSYPVNAKKSITIGKDLKYTGRMSIPDAGERIILDSRNPYFAMYEGMLYTKDFHTLVSSPDSISLVTIHPDTKVIAHLSLGGIKPRGPIIVPWGVTCIEDLAFSGIGWDSRKEILIILPDTLETIGMQRAATISTYTVYFYSPALKNRLDPWLDGGTDKIRQELLPESLKGAATIPEIYGRLRKIGSAAVNGWVDEGSSWRYYENGILQKTVAENTGAVYQNCLYSKDYRRLIAVPAGAAAVSFHPNVKTIGANSLPFNLTGTLVLPWGVTTVERDVFHNFRSRVTVVFPDTLASFDISWNNSHQAVFMISQGSSMYQTLLKTGTEIWMTSRLREDYYAGGTAQEAARGWKFENGKWYYYENGAKKTGWVLDNNVWYYLGADGVMQTGWMKASYGTYYYLRPWGGMMAGGWYQIGGKWYYFRDWGGMEQNKWIYGKDKKWYYAGADGAMLINIRTPDGYYVDAAGVWVR
jgi:hypothetical protein